MRKVRVTQLLACPRRALLSEEPPNAAVIRGRKEHEEIESMMKQYGWEPEKELCLEVGEVALCGHPDLIRVTDSYIEIVEYKSVGRLRPEYVAQLDAYRWLAARLYSRPVWGGLLLRNGLGYTLITDMNKVPVEIAALRPVVVRVEFEDLEAVGRRLLGLAAMGAGAPAWPAGHCDKCSLRRRCEAYGRYLAVQSLGLYSNM